MVVFPIDAAVEIQPGDGDATVLEPWDLAVLGGAPRCPGASRAARTRPAPFSSRP
jgi:hypothetical protein